MDATQSRQSGEYAFPYHYLPTFERDGFTQGRLWGYSLSYLGAMELILDQLATRQPKTYCDVGCGDGALVHFLSQRYEDVVFTGIDYDASAVRWAELFNSHGNDFLTADIVSDEIGKTFDVVSLIEVIEHIQPEVLPGFIGAITTLMHDDATLIITVPHANKPVQAKHYQHFTFDSLRQYVEPHFEIEDLFGFGHTNLLERVYG